MKKTLILLFLVVPLTLATQVAYAQSSSVTDTWYVWIETEVPVDNQIVKIVSAEPMVITCCVKSAKYRKFVRKAAQWITKNISSEFNGELELMKIKDEALAREMIEKAHIGDNIRSIEYTASCK